MLCQQCTWHNGRCNDQDACKAQLLGVCSPHVCLMMLQLNHALAAPLPGPHNDSPRYSEVDMESTVFDQNTMCTVMRTTAGKCMHCASVCCMRFTVWVHAENINCSSDSEPLKCGTCYKQIEINELLIRFTGPEVWWSTFSNGFSHHVDCVWPEAKEMSRKNIMMTNREVEQIKLELDKCPLEKHDIELLHARLDAMAANHNGYMHSTM